MPAQKFSENEPTFSHEKIAGLRRDAMAYASAPAMAMEDNGHGPMDSTTLFKHLELVLVLRCLVSIVRRLSTMRVGLLFLFAMETSVNNLQVLIQLLFHLFIT